jgi:hypothetical protein
MYEELPHLSGREVRNRYIFVIEKESITVGRQIDKQEKSTMSFKESIHKQKLLFVSRQSWMEAIPKKYLQY